MFPIRIKLVKKPDWGHQHLNPSLVKKLYQKKNIMNSQLHAGEKHSYAGEHYTISALTRINQPGLFWSWSKLIFRTFSVFSNLPVSERCNGRHIDLWCLFGFEHFNTGGVLFSICNSLGWQFLWDLRAEVIWGAHLLI